MKKIMDHNAYPEWLKTLTLEQLKHIQKDAAEAAAANPDGINAGYYLDEVNYCANEIHRRTAKIS